jgi:tetratricopeptide (TPR) repeat protein
LYESILAAEPQHFDALHLSGVLALQMRNPTRALERIGAAIRLRATEPAAYYNRAAAHEARADWAAALADYDAALALNPQHADAAMNRGTVLQRLGLFEPALASFDRAIALNGRHTAAHFNRGNLLREIGRWNAALASYDAVIARDPAYVEAHLNRGIVLKELERWEESLASYDRAVALQPGLATAHHNRANLLTRLGRSDEARAAYTQAVALDPNLAEAHVGLGLVLKERGEFEAARRCLEQAFRCSEPRAEWYFHHATVQSALGKFEEALASYERALALAPDYAQAHANRGNVLYRLRRFEAALSSLDRALALDPALAQAHANRGNVLYVLERASEAVCSYDRALSIDPRSDIFHVDRSMALLVEGELEAAWEGYERRGSDASAPAIAAAGRPRWRGTEPLAGKTILLHAEQGLGDTLQFCRYVPLVAERGAEVILCVQAPLVALLTSLSGAARVIALGSALPAFDAHCPLLSLPMAFRTTLQDIPATMPYLRADAAAVAAWRRRLTAPQGPIVGLAWSGNPHHVNDSRRSIALTEFSAALPVGPQYVCLQTDVRDADRAALAARRDISYFGDELGFDAAAAVCTSVDLVVSVDTSLAHLAGALGKPVWILLQSGPDWRWLTGRADSPWYPTARLYRQSTPGEWSDVLERVAGDLAQCIRRFAARAVEQQPS